MINDPNYNLPKDAFIRLFDNPIPAGDPARSEAPEWAQELDEVVVWAHMGDNGQVSVKVNGEDIGGGGATLATLSGTPGGTFKIPYYLESAGIFLSGTPSEMPVKVPVPAFIGTIHNIESITGDYRLEGESYVMLGDCNVVYSGGDN